MMALSLRRFATYKRPHTAAAIRLCSTEPFRSQEVPPLIDKFNESISENVMVTVPFFLGIRNATWYALVFGISQTVSIGPELGVAYMITKFSGKFRQPANIALAAAISQTFPVLRHIKASALFGAMQSDAPPSTEPPTMIEKAAKWVSAPLDKYGNSLYEI